MVLIDIISFGNIIQILLSKEKILLKMLDQQFFLAGINYKKSDASVRGSFAIGNEQYKSILHKAAQQQLKEVFIISTCNRTEIYGLVSDANVLIDLLCSETTGTKELFLDKCYVKQGAAAIEHIFSVAAGLDSQILGDYEIVGQMKTAFKFSKAENMIGAFLERLFNTVLQSSKAIKNQTELSCGTVSVAFAAIQFLKEQYASFSDKKITLLGTGKIGKNTCKNLIDYLETKNITILNRTDEKAEELALELGLNYSPFSNLNEHIQSSDIIIVATNAEEPIIKKSSLRPSDKKILIDLSIPNNIETSVTELPGIILANVDDLSKINDATLQKRLDEVSKAQAIIEEYMNEFHEWYCMRKHAFVLKSFKKTLHEVHCSCFNQSSINDEILQKGVNNLALKMRRQHTPGCNYIQAINDYIAQPAFV